MATTVPPPGRGPTTENLSASQIEERELGADGTFGLVGRLAQTRPGPNAPALLNALARIPAEPFGFPLVFWIGGVLFLGILFLTWSSYL